MEVILAILFVAVVALLIKFGNKKEKPQDNVDINVPPGDKKRTDLFFGYYGILRDQVEETKDHTNIMYSIQFEGLYELVANIKKANVPVVLDVVNQVGERLPGKKTTCRVDADVRLREFLDYLKKEGVLENIIAFVAVDEPNSQAESLEEWLKCMNTIKSVASEYEELKNVKTSVLLNGNDKMAGWATHTDWVGFDNYDAKSSIFRKGGLYDQVKAEMLPHQRTFLVPGGSYGQDPTPFVNFAQMHDEVIMVLPFLWFDAQDYDGTPIPGIRSGGKVGDPKIKQMYIDAGKSVVN